MMTQKLAFAAAEIGNSSILNILNVLISRLRAVCGQQIGQHGEFGMQFFLLYGFYNVFTFQEEAIAAVAANNVCVCVRARAHAHMRT